MEAKALAAEAGPAGTAAAKIAVQALAALAQEHRLAVFRLLVREGPPGLPAGTVAGLVGIPASTLSHHLAALEGAGLITSRRVERRIYYAVDIVGTRRLFAFLTEDCCRGRPELCGYRKEVCSDDDHHLSQSEVRDLAQRPGDDPQFR